MVKLYAEDALLRREACWRGVFDLRKESAKLALVAVVVVVEVVKMRVSEEKALTCLALQQSASSILSS